MTARNAAAIASLVAVVAASRWPGAPSFYEIPIETPIQPKMDVSPFQRVLVAGFIGGGTDDVDANLETVRLLRSQLRIEVDAARHRSGSAAARRHRAGTDARRDGHDRRRRPAAPPTASSRRRSRRRRRRSSAARARDQQRKGPRDVPEHLRRRRVLEEARRGIPEPADRHRHGAVHAAPDQPAS